MNCIEIKLNNDFIYDYEVELGLWSPLYLSNSASLHTCLTYFFLRRSQSSLTSSDHTTNTKTTANTFTHPGHINDWCRPTYPPWTQNITTANPSTHPGHKHNYCQSIWMGGSHNRHKNDYYRPTHSSGFRTTANQDIVICKSPKPISNFSHQCSSI